MAIGCAINGLLAGVVKTSAAKRAGLQHTSDSLQRLRRRWEKHQSQSANRGVERRLRVIQFVRRTFKRFDILKTCTSSASAHVIQHGARYIAGYHLAVRAHTHRRLDTLTTAPQARSRIRIPGRIPAMSISASVALERLSANTCSHFAQPGAADSHVLRSSDFNESSAIDSLPEPASAKTVILQGHVRGTPIRG
jgi:hypothetical protein